jgi:uncharacterized membrane protein
MKKKKLTYVVALAIVCTLFTAFGQLFQKMGVDELELSLPGIITNIPLIAGVLLYIIGGVVMIYALKQAELSVVYPFFSLSFIWVAILSVVMLKESIVFLHGLGILVIISGVCFVGRGAMHD